MRRGVRDLHILTSDLDAGSQSVVEAIQRKVLSLEKVKEKELASDSLASSDDMPPPIPALSRQLSVGSSTKACLAGLQLRLPDGEFKEILFTLLQIFKSIRNDQSELANRRFKKDHPMVCRCILPHPEIMEIFQAVGFEDCGEYLSLNILNRDSILRTVTILAELAASEGIE